MIHMLRSAFDRRRHPRGVDRRGSAQPSVNPWAQLDAAVDAYLQEEADTLAPAWWQLPPLARLALWIDHRTRMGPALWLTASGAHRALPPEFLDALAVEAKVRLAALLTGDQ